TKYGRRPRYFWLRVIIVEKGEGEKGVRSGEAVSSPYHPKTLSPYLLPPDSTDKLFQQTLFNLTTPWDR
ncbi:hypothetical protein, partial [Microcystis aeruginosa]|uniref:hypothetical protein n=2 Tax=Microcystis TaxID=1125 RepID=UPI0032AFEA11